MHTQSCTQKCIYSLTFVQHTNLCACVYVYVVCGCVCVVYIIKSLTLRVTVVQLCKYMDTAAFQREVLRTSPLYPVSLLRLLKNGNPLLVILRPRTRKLCWTAVTLDSMAVTVVEYPLITQPR